MQLAKVSIPMLDRHTLSLDYIPAEGLRDLVIGAVQAEFMPVQVTHLFFIPKQCLLQRDV